jgi:SET domain-containing protein
MMNAPDHYRTADWQSVSECSQRRESSSPTADVHGGHFVPMLDIIARYQTHNSNCRKEYPAVKQSARLTYVAISPIHGKGLFARADIKTGTYLGTYQGPEAKRNGSHVLWVYFDDDTVIGRRGMNKLRYLNHSKRANAEFDGFDLYATRSISPNEEITINYDAV